MTNIESPAMKKILDVTNNRKYSEWLRGGLKSAIRRDPKDAMADAESMAWLLKDLWEEKQEKGVLR